jgi:rhodanese-related sulfurtransferase
MGEAAPTIDELLERARRRFRRLGPEAAYAAWRDGALLVDTRPEAHRRNEGTIPGAVVVERNHLEWRLDPRSAHRIPEAADPDRLVVVVCDEGYASSFAAASLCDLGVEATDLDGGFRAWLAAGLPVEPPA